MELYYPLLTYFLIRLRTRLSSQKMPIRVRHALCAIGTARVGTSASLLHVAGNSCRTLRFFSIIITRRMLSQGDLSNGVNLKPTQPLPLFHRWPLFDIRRLSCRE